MDNVTFVQIPGIDGEEIEHAIIDRGDGNFTSMRKSTYDEMLKQQSNNSDETLAE